MDAVDETSITEITIGPDGRVYVFGLSREVLSVLAAVCPGDSAVEDRLSRLTSHEMSCDTTPAGDPASERPARLATRGSFESTAESSP